MILGSVRKSGTVRRVFHSDGMVRGMGNPEGLRRLITGLAFCFPEHESSSVPQISMVERVSYSRGGGRGVGNGCYRVFGDVHEVSLVLFRTCVGF